MDQITGVYIYSERNFNLSMPARGRFSGKRVSLGDLIFIKWGLVILGLHSREK